jgi:hypothetical protein
LYNVAELGFADWFSLGLAAGVFFFPMARGSFSNTAKIYIR